MTLYRPYLDNFGIMWYFSGHYCDYGHPIWISEEEDFFCGCQHDQWIED